MWEKILMLLGMCWHAGLPVYRKGCHAQVEGLADRQPLCWGRLRQCAPQQHYCLCQAVQGLLLGAALQSLLGARPHQELG